jgi:hypothetical protein
VSEGEDQKPTADEQAGMTWWNQLTEDERAKALSDAKTAVVAEAWAHYKRERGIGLD